MIPISQDFQISLVLPPFSKTSFHSLGFYSLTGEQPIRPRRALALGHDDRTTILRYTFPGSSSTTSLATQDIPMTMPLWMKGLRKVLKKGSSRSDLEVTEATLGVLYQLSKDFGNIESPAYGQVYVRGHIVDFSPANIAHNLCCPHFSDIEGTRLEEEVDFDEVIQVLTGESGAVWPKTNRLNLNLLKMLYRDLFRVFCGCWLPTTNITIVLKEMAHLLYAFATRKRINLCIVIFRNILRNIDQKKPSKIVLPSPCLISEYILRCRDLSLPTDSWMRELNLLVMPNIIAPGIVPPSPKKVYKAAGFKIKKLVPRGSLEELKGFNCAECKEIISEMLSRHGPKDVGLAELCYRLLCLVLNHTTPHIAKSVTLHRLP
ncbi:hypothetical protein M9H77_18529 [Catharanthus roseus]|uniref:Uncharacterized protein n=1 Tax=Catharanthus roseus TaxID=4058 RepID=A0ACC0B7Q2_CATRO|nr:hypothetical protein M9H77_18529 [Catharanthus roseus]